MGLGKAGVAGMYRRERVGCVQATADVRSRRDIACRRMYVQSC